MHNYMLRACSDGVISSDGCCTCLRYTMPVYPAPFAPATGGEPVTALAVCLLAALALKVWLRRRTKHN